jgi:hypothetical protein
LRIQTRRNRNEKTPKRILDAAEKLEKLVLERAEKVKKEYGFSQAAVRISRLHAAPPKQLA